MKHIGLSHRCPISNTRESFEDFRFIRDKALMNDSLELSLVITYEDRFKAPLTIEDENHQSVLESMADQVMLFGDHIHSSTPVLMIMKPLNSHKMHFIGITTIEIGLTPIVDDWTSNLTKQDESLPIVIPYTTLISRQSDECKTDYFLRLTQLALKATPYPAAFQ